jgi:hypothetical protein
MVKELQQRIQIAIMKATKLMLLTTAIYGNFEVDVSMEEIPIRTCYSRTVSLSVFPKTMVSTLLIQSSGGFLWGVV